MSNTSEVTESSACRKARQGHKVTSEEIEGVIIREMKRFSDSRGWLMECFRHDELSKEIYPAMSYVSMTYPGVVRGPHEHVGQTDYFCFAGPSTFKLYLWDNRKCSPTYGNKMTILVGEGEPAIVIIPPGVVHAYRNIGQMQGLVLNFPNRLFAGWGKKEGVDEIRYENDNNCPFKID